MSQPLMMTVREFAALHHVSESTVECCIKGESTVYPALKVKRAGRRRYITAEAAA